MVYIQSKNITEIAQTLIANPSAEIETRINRYKYTIKYPNFDTEIAAIPANTCDIARKMKYDNYAYTHGGATFRAAVEVINDVCAEIERIENMTDLEEVLEDHNTYRGQIELYFDKDGDECIPAAAETILVWSQGPRKIGYYEK